MKSTHSYDVLVIGSGMAGMTIANKCAKKGLKTAITDFRPYGGTCALRGCDPKKILIGAAEIIDRANKMEGNGLIGNWRIHWPDLMKFKTDFTSKVSGGIEKGYSSSGVDMYHGSAHFVSADTVRINNEEIKATKIAITTGARAVTLSIPGGDIPIDSTEFLELETLPEEITFIGGGYIAFEFAHLAARAGSKVNIIHRGPYPLENFEQDMVTHLVKATKELGISILLSTEVTAVEKVDEKYRVLAKTSDSEISVHSDLVINAAGRVPELDGLNLKAAEVKYENKNGIEVNEFLQSVSNPKIYAAGDSAASEGLPLTPVAVLEGHTVAANIIRGNSKKPDYTEMPTAVFTLPAMASVGLTEEQVKAKGIKYIVKSANAANWYNAKRIKEDTYGYKVLVGEDGQILGAHIIGPHAEETINLFATAIKAKMKTADIRNMVYSYPSMGSDIGSMV